MSRQAWTPERVRQVQEQVKNNKTTVAQVAKEQKFSMSAYYRHKKIFGVAKRPYTKRIQLEVAPHYDILPKQFQTKNKIVILITDISSAKSLINEIF
jgi:hypothetical protein